MHLYGSSHGSRFELCPVPSPGPRFFLPSWSNPCQARGVRVVGYLASGPTGAATLVLRQQVLTMAKLRGRHSIFLFGVIAASPCCTWYTGQLAEVQPPHRPSSPPALYLLSTKANILSSCQLARFSLRWPQHAALLASAPGSTCSYEQWPLFAPVTVTPLPTHSADCSVLATRTWDMHARRLCIRAPASVGPFGEPSVACEHLLAWVTNHTGAGTTLAPLAPSLDSPSRASQLGAYDVACMFT